MKRLLGIAAALTLTGCAGPTFSLFPKGEAKAQAEAAPKTVCPTAIGGVVQKRPVAPPNAAYPAPATDAESQSVVALRLWLLSVVEWGEAGWKIVDADNKVCAQVKQ